MADVAFSSKAIETSHEMTPRGGDGLLAPMPGYLSFAAGIPAEFVRFTGVSVEKGRVWTAGPITTLTFVMPPNSGARLAMTFELSAFIWPEVLEQQAVEVTADGEVLANWTFLYGAPTKRALLLPPQERTGRDVTLQFSVPTHARPASFGINKDERELGIAFRGIRLHPVTDPERFAALTRQYGRPVGPESRGSFDHKLESGFWDRYIAGPNVLDVGFKGGGAGRAAVVPIVEGAIGVDLDYPGYDGKTLPFPTNSQDAVYSSHCLEHIPHYIRAIQEWYRVIKVGGHIITVVPNALLYERKRTPPSRWNRDHQRFYTPSSLLAEFEHALLPNTYRVRHLAENDMGYVYSSSLDEPPLGCYEIELVIQKIEPPAWRLGD